MSDSAGEKSEVVRTGAFTVPASELWTLVADFGGLDKIMDGIDSCELEGEGVGARRTIPMGDSAVVESLDVLDHDAMTLTYSIVEGPLPFKNYSATMVVSSDGDESSSLTWTGSFIAEGIPKEKAEHLAGGIYSGGIAGFTKALGR